MMTTPWDMLLGMSTDQLLMLSKKWGREAAKAMDTWDKNDKGSWDEQTGYDKPVKTPGTENYKDMFNGPKNYNGPFNAEMDNLRYNLKLCTELLEKSIKREEVLAKSFAEICETLFDIAKQLRATQNR